MSTTPAATAERGLHRVLGTWDLVLLNIAAIVGLRWLSTAAQIGPSSLVLWLLGMLCFFIPTALAVMAMGCASFFLTSSSRGPRAAAGAARTAYRQFHAAIDPCPGGVGIV